MKWLKKKEKTLTLKPGMVFEKYTVEKELGHGGMGMVYLIRHNMLDSHFALKVLDSEVAGKNKQFVDRFIREAKLACKIRHPNLITVHDAGMNPDTGLYYIVMDYVPGGSVRDILKAKGRIPPERALEIIRQTAGALCAAYAHHMVHRDIKPDNIMFAVDGSAKLADLGIAKSTDEHDPTLTMAATVFGTPSYMSPEQARDSSKVDIRADIYSLGVVFYEMLSGQRPFNGTSAMSILSQVMGPQKVPDIRGVAPDVPQELASLIAEMTEKDLDKRIANPDILLKKLNEIRLPVRQNASQSVGGRPSAQEAGIPDVTLPTMAGVATPDVTLATVPPPETVSATDVTLATVSPPETTAIPDVTMATVPPPETVATPDITLATVPPPETVPATPDVTLATVPPPETVETPDVTLATVPPPETVETPDVTLATVPPPETGSATDVTLAPVPAQSQPPNKQVRPATVQSPAATPNKATASASSAGKSPSEETDRRKTVIGLLLIAVSFLVLAGAVGGAVYRFLPSIRQIWTSSKQPQQPEPRKPEQQQPEPIPVYVLQIVTTPDSNIILTSGDGHSQSFTSDHEGKCEITDLQAGNYTVSISRDGYIPVGMEVALNGNRTLDLPMTAKPPEKNQVVLIAVDSDYSRVVEKELDRVFGPGKVAYLVSDGASGYADQLDNVVKSEPSAVVFFLEGAVSNYEHFFSAHADVLKKKGIPFAFVLMPEDEDEQNTNKYNIAVRELIRNYDFTLIRPEEFSSDLKSFKEEHGLQ